MLDRHGDGISESFMDKGNPTLLIDVDLYDDEGNFHWIKGVIDGLNEYAKAVPEGLRFSLDPDGTLVGLFFGKEGRGDWPVI